MNHITTKCPECGERVMIFEGLVETHDDQRPGSYCETCPGSGSPVSRPVPFSENVARVAARLSIGQPALGDRFSAGPYTPAVAEGFPYAVLDLQGAPVVLAHDAYDTAVWLVKLESGAIDPPSAGEPPVCLVHYEEATRFARIESEQDSCVTGYFSSYAAHLDRKRARDAVVP